MRKGHRVEIEVARLEQLEELARAAVSVALEYGDILEASVPGPVYPWFARRAKAFHAAEMRQYRKEETERQCEGHRSGVYVLYDAACDLHKIGCSRNWLPSRIWTQISDGLCKVDLVMVFPTSRAFALEAFLHERFAPRRVCGEWFWFDSEGEWSTWAVLEAVSDFEEQR